METHTHTHTHTVTDGRRKKQTGVRQLRPAQHSSHQRRSVVPKRKGEENGRNVWSLAAGRLSLSFFEKEAGRRTRQLSQTQRASRNCSGSDGGDRWRRGSVKRGSVFLSCIKNRGRCICRRIEKQKSCGISPLDLFSFLSNRRRGENRDDGWVEEKGRGEKRNFKGEGQHDELPHPPIYIPLAVTATAPSPTGRRARWPRARTGGTTYSSGAGRDYCGERECKWV